MPLSRIYRNHNQLFTTIFDLIGNDNEVKQTLALGYLMSNDHDFLQQFLDLEDILKIFGKTSLEAYSKVVVHTEMGSDERKRLDIVIQLYKENIPSKALIIEAKSISTGVVVREVEKQLSNYLEDRDTFPLLTGFQVHGVTLTKESIQLKSGVLGSITWTTVLKLLANSKGLKKDYLNYLTNIEGTMNFYEKEVYSIPAGNSYHFQYDYPHIYECPNEGKNFKAVKKPLYFAFRKQGGIMERLFGVEEIIILNPSQDLELFYANPKYTSEVKDRVREYCETLWGQEKLPNEEKQFYILSLKNQIELKHKPRPKKNNSFRAYYYLAELLDEKQIFVKPEGK